MKTNVYKRFDPRLMEREERIGINRGLPTMCIALPARVLFAIKIIIITFVSWQSVLMVEETRVPQGNDKSLTYFFKQFCIEIIFIYKVPHHYQIIDATMTTEKRKP